MNSIDTRRLEFGSSAGQRRSTEGPLTLAERRAALLVADGLTYKEAAQRLSISPATVRNQLHSVYKKLGAVNKAVLSKQLNTTRI